MSIFRRFSSRLLLCVVFVFIANPTGAFSQITTPESYLGFEAGADFHLATYEQAIGYFELIASQTERMQIFDMGITSEGRRMKYAVISSEENMANLNRYKEINKKLSLVRGVTEEEARSLADEGKAIVWIDGGLHATEVAPAQHNIQLAYDMVTENDRRTRLIRENVILVLVFANPDGMTIVSDWYMGNVGTPYEVSSLPWLYHKYAGHDNNRDSFIANLIETQNMNNASCNEWYPAILFNQHQTAPFPARIWIPPDSEPTNPNIHPIILRWRNLIGSSMGKAFEEANQPGAISRILFDSWYPGYATQVVDGHNIVSILTETQLYRYATPQHFTLNDFPEAHRDLTVGTFYPSPWKGGWWRIGDAVDYNITASKSVLETAAKYRYEFLYNKYRVGNDVIEQFKNEPPYGWIFPAEQKDQYSTALMMNRFMTLGVEIYQAEEDFTDAGITYKKGSYLIPASQPFGLFVKNILEIQDYPDLRKYLHLWQGIVGLESMDGPPLRAYDGVGWTLPLQMGIEFREMSKYSEVSKTLITEAAAPAPKIDGSGSQYVFTHTDNNSFTALNKIFAAGGKVSWTLEDLSLSGNKYAKGSFVVEGNSISAAKIKEISDETKISMRKGNVKVKTENLRKPRIALYRSWQASMDAGWMTLIFEQFEFPYHSLVDAEVKAGSLKNRFDVIVLPDQRASSIINGHRKGTIPPDYAGGMTEQGVENLVKFVKEGGVLVCNNSSSDLAIDKFKLPVKNILSGVPADSFNCPGSILKMNYEVDHPITFGLEENGIAFFSRGRVFEIKKDTTKQDAPKVIARYPEGSLLKSGWMIGEERIQGKPAALDVKVDKGRVILFGFNVHNRAQAHATFKLLFNSFLYK